MIMEPDNRILLVEDEPTWIHELTAILRRFGSVDHESHYEGARARLTNTLFDLAVVDLGITERGSGLASSTLGVRLLNDWQQNPSNRSASMIVVTVDVPQMRDVFRNNHVSDFIDKAPFDAADFVRSVRAALRDSRIRRASQAARARYRLSITFSRDAVQGCVLEGPDYRMARQTSDPVPFDGAHLAGEADALGVKLLKDGAAAWRPEMKRIGMTLEEQLSTDRRVVESLAAARARATQSEDLWLRFSGPRESLGFPFELLRDHDEYFALRWVLTRHLADAISRNTEPFHELVARLVKDSSPFRALVVGSNSDGRIPQAEVEATEIKQQFEAILDDLAIRHEIDLLVGPSATYALVRQHLEQRKYHLVHYAGHGRFDDDLAEVSGLLLLGGTLSASDLKLIAQRTSSPHMLYLSCCLGARTAQAPGRGDFYGVMDALGQADVAAVLGFRWTVADEPARMLALSFYRELWRTLEPGSALLRARHALAMKYGRDDVSWASPVLLVQNH
jgi:DNA-binding response OmpR family regulator